MGSDPSFVRFPCKACKKILQASPALVGKSGKCRHCGTSNLIPQLTTPLVSNRSRSGDAFLSNLSDAIAEATSLAVDQIKPKKLISPEDVTTCITGILPRNKVSIAYRLHLFLVAVTMTFLPILYVILVGLVGFGVVFYSLAIAPNLWSSFTVGRAGLFIAIGIVAPVVAGSILILFMVKPLLFRAGDFHRRRSLSRSGEPVIFALVDRICESTGAPKPIRIDVNYLANASAGPEKGLFSIVSGRMVVTIGVPLIAGLTARQLAGILAHEFGHFSQKIGMGSSFLIRRVNFWFERVVYQRDRLDEWLEQSIEELDIRIGLVLQFAAMGVAMTRGVLWCFMTLGHLVSAALLRQMELDADRYEYGLVGSKTFEASFKEIKLLQWASAQTISTLEDFALRGRLADNMLYFMGRTLSSAPVELQQAVISALHTNKVGAFSTHPSDALRIDRARKAQSEGMFTLDCPARELTRHFDSLCQGVTADFYRDQIGRYVPPDNLTPSYQLWHSLSDQSRATDGL